MTSRRNEAAEEHVQTALQFLEHSDREFDAGDDLQCSEKLWGAASHAVMAVAMQRGWDFGKNTARERAVDRLDSEFEGANLREGFFAARQFHANFNHDFMEDNDFERGRPMVRQFVHFLAELAGNSGGPGQ